MIDKLIDKIENDDNWKDTRVFNMAELNKNTLIYEEDKQAYLTHPCKFCSHNKNANAILVFDIAFGYKGRYNYVFEIEYTSPVTPFKVKFCKENDIMLFSLRYEDLLSSKLKNRHFRAKLLT